MQEIDVIIPVYRPGKELVELIERLEHQSVPVHRILLVNTEEKYWKAFEYDHPHRKRYENIRLWHISKREFDHGKTRREAVKKSKAGIFVMISAGEADGAAFSEEYGGLLCETASGR